MSSDEKPKVNVILLFEVIGRPPEHLVAALEDLIKRLDGEKGVSVQKKNIKEPKEIEQKEGVPSKGFYTTFAEVEAELDDISSLVYLMFRYMPAHVEVLSPEVISFTNNKWNELFNELTRRLHGYDEIARVLQAEKSILEKKLRELTGKGSGQEGREK